MFFCRVWIRLITVYLHFHFRNSTNLCTCLELWSCPMNSALHASPIRRIKSKSQRDLSHFTCKSKCSVIIKKISITCYYCNFRQCLIGTAIFLLWNFKTYYFIFLQGMVREASCTDVHGIVYISQGYRRPQCTDIKYIETKRSRVLYHIA